MQQDTLTVHTEPVAHDTVQAAVQTTTSTAAQPDTAVRQPVRTVSLPIDSTSVVEEPEADTTAVVPDSLPLLYLGNEHIDSLLAADSMLFRGNAGYRGSGAGMQAQPLPPALFRNDGVSIALLSCFLLTLLYLASSRRRLSERIKTFFRPKQSTTTSSIAEPETYEWVHLLLGCQLSIIGALLFYSYAREQLSVDLINLTPLTLLGIYTAVFMTMLIVKQRLYHFVHAIFFTIAERRRWYESYSLLFIIESLVLFPLALLSVYFDLAPEKVSISLAILLLFVKILLFFKSFSVFFGKLKGCLHLILYFCALEAIPLFIAVGILIELTRLFITIF